MINSAGHTRQVKHPPECTMKRYFTLLPTLLLSVSCSLPLGNPGQEESPQTPDPVNNAATPSGGGTRLQATEWSLQSIAGTPAEAGMNVTLRLQNDRFHGNAGCNRYSGSYASESGGKIRIQAGIVTTKMACPQPRMDFERAYLSALGKSTIGSVTDGKLILSDTNQQPLLVFVPRESVNLENVHWQARSINNGHGGVVTTPATGKSSAQFSDGTIHGNAGCNQYSATYNSAIGQLKIGPLRSTRMHCGDPEGLMNQEQQFLDALARASRYTIASGRLELRSEDGALQIQFVQAPGIDDRSDTKAE